MMPSNPSAKKTHNKKTPARLSVNVCHESLGQLDGNSNDIVEGPRKIGGEGLKPTNFAVKRCPTRDSKCSGDSGVGIGRDWFDRSNENPGERSGQMIVDDDPPFFQRNQSSVSDDNMGEEHFANRVDVQFPPGFIHQPTNGSSIDDFRSVIDDLTVENRRLKDRLRKYELSSSIQPEKDKLFELKVHRLSPYQKRQLEETLQTFASSIVTNDSKAGDDHLSLSKVGRNKYSTTIPKLKIGSSSVTSDSRRLDSGYASLSTPGLNSSSVNYIGKDMCTSPITAKTKTKKVQSLDDVPLGLLSQERTNMPERTKKNLVVRRLEQLFTGERVFSGSDSCQTRRQQEVSNLAARYDNRTDDCKWSEGLREAHILESEMEVDKIERPGMHRISSHESTDEKSGNGSDYSSKQRPTRPLDLDPDRTQVPSENMAYIRHLGLPAPELLTANATNVAADSDGWVYLNLLVNMAQLHIINVTLGFIRTAVSEVSTKFQLSPDGKKIRWRGGTEGTRFGSDSGADSTQYGSPNDSDSLEEGARKRPRIGVSPREVMALEQGLRCYQFSMVPINTRGNQRARASTKQEKIFHYEPLFQHHRSAGYDEMSVDDSDSLVSLKESEVGVVDRKFRTSGSPLGQRDGAIVFYSGAPFCVDLSADRDNISTPLHVNDVGRDNFSNHSHDALGCHGETSPPRPSRTSPGPGLSYRPFKDYPICPSPLRDDESSQRLEPKVPESASDNLEFSPEWAATELQQQAPLLNLDASGLGGSRPADHFVITVKMSRPTFDSKIRARMPNFSAKRISTSKNLHNISLASLETFFSPENATIDQLSALRANSPPSFAARNGNDLPVKARLLSTQVHRLRPSALPPPTNFCSEYSSCDSSVSKAASDSHSDTRTAKTNHTQESEASAYDDDRMNEDNSSDDDDDEASGDDSSIDMLAQAREMDPATVAALERQFEPSESSKSSNATAGHDSDVSNNYSSAMDSDES